MKSPVPVLEWRVSVAERPIQVAVDLTFLVRIPISGPEMVKYRMFVVIDSE